MTRIPPIRDDLAFLRATTRPGSIEARFVYRCSCAEDMQRTRPWNPDDVARWQADIDLGCPAHGRLLERYLSEVNRTLGRSGEAVHEVACVTRERPRSLTAKLEDAWRGAVRGWRGV